MNFIFLRSHPHHQLATFSAKISSENLPLQPYYLPVPAHGTWPRCILKVVTNSWVFLHFPIWRIFLVSPAAKPAGNPSEAIFSLVSWKNNSEVPYISSQCPAPQQNGAPTAYGVNHLIHTPWFTCLPFFPVLFLYSFLLLPRWPLRESICMQIIVSKSFFKQLIILGGVPKWREWFRNYLLFLYEISRKDELIETASRQVVAQDWIWEQELIMNRCGRSC